MSKLKTVDGPQRIAELDSEISGLLDEAKSIVDLATNEDRELTDDELARLNEISEEDSGQIYTLKDEREKLQSRVNAKKRLALQIEAQQGRRDPFGSPMDGVPMRGPDAAAPHKQRAQFVDANGRRIHAYGVNDPLPQAVESDSDRPSLAERIHAHVTGKPLERPRGQSLFEGDDGAGGFLTTTEDFGQIINVTRPRTVAFQAGAQLVPMESPEMQIVQQLSDPEVGWHPELAEVPGSSMNFGRIMLRPKKLAAIMSLSMELLEDAANGTQIVQNALAQAVAVALDKAILSGAGTDAEPRGIRNEPGVSVVAVDTPPAADYSDIESAIEAIDMANYPGEASDLAWIANPRDVSQYNRLQAADMQPLQPTPGAAALRQFKTTSLPIDLGTGSNESEMIVGDMSQVIVGMRTTGRIRFLPTGAVNYAEPPLTIEAAKQFAMHVAIHMRADVAVIRPEWLTVIKDVRWS